MKEVFWVGRSLDEIRAFPEEARREAGHSLFRVQLGEEPGDWRPMPAIGQGVMELRLHAASEHRVFYVVRFAEAVYVLHCFQKKSQRTPSHNLEVGRRRLRELQRWRQDEGL